MMDNADALTASLRWPYLRNRVGSDRSAIKLRLTEPLASSALYNGIRRSLWRRDKRNQERADLPTKKPPRWSRRWGPFHERFQNCLKRAWRGGQPRRPPRRTRAAARVVPGKRANCPPALGRRTHKNFGAVGDPAKQQKPVLIALSQDKRFWVKRDARDFGVSSAAFARGLVDRPVLILERPNDRGIGSGSRQPMAIEGPGQRARFRRIAAHAHVLLVGDAPSVQRVFLHRVARKRPSGDAVMERCEPFHLNRSGGAAAFGNHKVAPS